MSIQIRATHTHSKREWLDEYSSRSLIMHFLCCIFLRGISPRKRITTKTTLGANLYSMAVGHDDLATSIYKGKLTKSLK